MADHPKEEEKKGEPLMEKIADKVHDADSSSSSSSSSSSDSDDDKKKTTLKRKVNRLFGRERPIHKVLGGGKAADVLLWRDKKASATVLGVATAIWFLFDVLEYHLLSLICHGLMVALTTLFVWSNASMFIKKSPPHIPDVCIPEEPVLKFASDLRIEINRTFAGLKKIATGKDVKQFLLMIAGLWFLSIVGGCCDFLTLLYTIAVLLFTVPLFYEKNEDRVDAYGEKAVAEIKKQYAVFDAKVLSKIPRGPLNKKSD